MPADEERFARIRRRIQTCRLQAAAYRHHVGVCASRSSAAADVADVRYAVTRFASTNAAIRLVVRSKSTMTYSTPGVGAERAMPMSFAGSLMQLLLTSR
jgi:hypothetical protein